MFKRKKCLARKKKPTARAAWSNPRVSILTTPKGTESATTSSPQGFVAHLRAGEICRGDFASRTHLSVPATRARERLTSPCCLIMSASHKLKGTSKASG